MSTESGVVDDVRRDVTEWLDANWNPNRRLREWRGLLADSGWGCPTWPVGWCGRGLSAHDAQIVCDEFARAGAVGVANNSAVNVVAPTLIAHGSEELRVKLVRPAVVGEHRWTQLFSEPDTGSDLAGLTTRADYADGSWSVNGQKLWSSGAEKAEYGLLLARTDWSVPKHQGITCFVVDMRQRGVSVRPLRQMNDHATFSEVHLADVRVPDDGVVGVVGGGWAVARTTLTNERHAATNVPPSTVGAGRCLQEYAEETAQSDRMYGWYPQRYGRPDLVAQAHSSDPVVRQLIAKVVTLQYITQWNAARARGARKPGRQAGPEGSLAKLAVSALARAAAAANAQLAGPAVLRGGTTTAEILLSVPSASIAGGTDEIQKNIIAERILGLPKEANSDVSLPFRDVPRNAIRNRDDDDRFRIQ